MAKLLFAYLFVLLVPVAQIHAMEVKSDEASEEWKKDISWNWDIIDTSDISFPKDFLWGVGTSKVLDEQENAQLAKNLGVNLNSVVVEWGKVEPQEGVFDRNELQRYVRICDELISNNIRPMIILHHYTNENAIPAWFADKGGFEKMENIQDFVRFATEVTKALRGKAQWIEPFVSPASYAAQGWLTGDLSPNKKDMSLMTEVLKNLLETHVQVRNAVKGTSDVKIMFNHHIFPIEPWHAVYNPLRALENIACTIADRLTNDCVIKFFTSGIFYIDFPFKDKIKTICSLAHIKCPVDFAQHINLDAPKSVDAVGIDYYSHGYMDKVKAIPDPEREKTQHETFTVYPEGLWRAIAQVSKQFAKPLNVPMIIAENGIATDDDEQRERFLKRHLYALSKALRDGYNVTGYCYSNLMDNNVEKRSGLYTSERKLKRGAQYFIDVIKGNVGHKKDKAKVNKSGLQELLSVERSQK